MVAIGRIIDRLMFANNVCDDQDLQNNQQQQKNFLNLEKLDKHEPSCRETLTVLILIRAASQENLSSGFRTKPGCTITDGGYRLKFSDLRSRGIVLSM